MTIDSDRQNVTSVCFIYIFLSFSYVSLYLCCVHCQLSIYALVSFLSEECTSRGEEVRLDRFRLREKERGTDSWTNTWASRIQRREIPRHAEARVWWKKEVGVVFLFFLHASRDRAREDSFYRNRYCK